MGVYSQKKLTDITVETWTYDSQYPDGSPDEKGVITGIYPQKYDTHAKAVFSLLEKDGKVEAVVRIDRLKEYNIPVYLELGAHKILVQP